MECDVCYDCMNISIHALRGEGDAIAPVAAAATLVFQSTPSVGRATFGGSGTTVVACISIHALRGEGDFFENVARNGTIISIHALRGEGDDLWRT